MKQISSGVSSIPKHPERHVARLTVIFLLCCLVETIAVGVFSLRPSLASAMNPIMPAWMLCGEVGLCLAFLVVRGYWRVHVLQGIERRRVTSVRETSVSTAVSEHASQGELAPLLSAIPVFPQRVYVWRRVVYLSLGALALCMYPLLDMFAGVHIFVFQTLSLILVGFFTCACASIALSLLKAESIIEAREGGLHVETGGSHVRTEQIDWDEARLFASYTVPNFMPGEKTQYYELSSATQVIIWISESRTALPLPIWRPDLPAHERVRQMQALCDVITAKTGLALCDLTGPRSAKSL